MKNWIKRLHGGQLVILVAFMLAAGAGFAALSAAFYREASRGYETATLLQLGTENIPRDPAGAAEFRQWANHDFDLALAAALVGIAIGAMVIATSWIWLGARRQPVVITR